MDFLNKFCCICMKFNKHLNLLHENNWENETFFSRLASSVPEMEISELHDYGMICFECSSDLNRAYKFRKKCLGSRKVLEARIKQIRSINTTRDGIKNNKIPDRYEKQNHTYEDNDLDCSIKSETLFIKTEYEEISSETEDPPLREIETIYLQSQTEDSAIDDTTADKNQIGRNTEAEENLSNTVFKNYENICEDVTSVNSSEEEISVKKPVETGKKYKCPTCDKSFNRNKDLTDHKRVHSGESPLTCEWCDKSFKKLSNLNSHKRIHLGDRRFKCEICEKNFSKRYNLIVHLRTHSGEKPFSCELCQKSFTHKSHLILHKRVHSGEKPFSCGTCGKNFAQISNLLTHEYTHSGLSPFKCKFCDKAFLSNYDVVRHQRIHTGEKPFKCQLCKKMFTENSKLVKHQMKHTEELKK